MELNYRKVYEQHYGKIPVDEEGRKYDIHHKDGNRSNNNLDNLVALSIEEHYKIHYEQGDWNACLIMSARMKKSPEIISELSKKTQIKRIEDGTHNFLDSEFQRNNQLERVRNGSHPFIGLSKKMVENGTHPFQHQKKSPCIHCGKIMASGPMINHLKSCGKEKELIKKCDKWFFGNGILYKKLIEAAKDIGVSKQAIHQRLRSPKFKSWFYIKDGVK